MIRLKKFTLALMLTIFLLPNFASSFNESDEQGGERRFWGWETNPGGTGVQYCGGECFAIIRTRTYYVLWIAVASEEVVEQATPDCPCGNYER